MCANFQSNWTTFGFLTNFGKLPNYVQYFGSNIQGVAESWLEVEMSWVEADGAGWGWVHRLVIPFDDIFKNLPLVVSYTPVMLHSQWHYWSSSLHMEYPWYNVPSHTISRSWDTSGGRGGPGCIPPNPLLPRSHVRQCITPVHKLLAQLCCCLGLQLYWR